MASDKQDELRFQLLSAQLELARSEDRAVVVLVAGHAGTGKGHLINRLNHWLENRLTEVQALVPSEDDRRHPYWWRYWTRLPARGRIGIFVHGWVGDALFAGAARRLGDGALADRLQEIVTFESDLRAAGITLVKLWLDIDAEVQGQHLAALEADPETRWQVTEEKWQRHSQHEAIQQLGQQLRRATATDESPWLCLDASPGSDLLTPVAEHLIAAMEDGGRPVAATSRPVIEHSVLKAVPQLSDLAEQTGAIGKTEYREQLASAQAQLAELARRAVWRGIPLVVVFEGHDAAGKGGSIHRLTSALDARTYRVHSIAAPSEQELRYPWQWRFWQRLPTDGSVAVFDRSWYGRVLVERVESLIDEPEWRLGYHQIVDFEDQLLSHGAVLVKLFMAIDSGEQLKRFNARSVTPHKQHKLTDEDWRNRARWDDYQQAIDDMLSATHRSEAPWKLVDANDKRRARLAVLHEVTARLADRLQVNQ